MTQRLTLVRPDDWHLHLRDGAMLQAVLPESSRHFARALIMPNLVPPVVTVSTQSVSSRYPSAPAATVMSPSALSRYGSAGELLACQ
jgi:dihydroorotase